jgi:hypothetical protein
MSPQFKSRAVFVVGVLGLACSMATGLAAQIAAVPEIDGASISAGVAVLSAGVLMLRARWRSK